jgi:hypothetical protein
MTGTAKLATHKAFAAPKIEVFRARAWARAYLYMAGELDLQEAVDELQRAAERDGLVAEVGQDEIQAILTNELSKVRDALAR